MAQTRRKLASSAALLMIAGIGSGAVNPTPSVTMTPITAAATRLARLSVVDQELLTDDDAHALCVEQCDLAASIMDSPPQTVVDTVVLLMVAAAEIQGDDLHENGTFAYERGDIVVRRVMSFLARQAGVSLADFGGTYFLCADEHEEVAYKGTVLDAAAAYNGVGLAVAQERREDRADHFRRHYLRSQNTPEMQRRVADLVAEASKKWANISDDDPRFDAGRAMLERAGVALAGKT